MEEAMKRKSHLAVLLAVLTLITIIASSLFALTASAADNPTPPEVENAEAACLYDKTHGKALVMKNADVKLNTSTSAKVMMGLVACEMLSNRLDEAVTVTEDMLRGADGYSMKLKAGESIKIRDLLYGAICSSYNDAAYVLASVCSGSSQSFVAKMNEKAKSLGAAATTYTNPIGYPDNDAMVTTLSDTLKIALAASENQLYMEISSAKGYTADATNMSSKREMTNRNKLLVGSYFNSKCSGMNAGISGEAGGWSIVTLAKDDGAEYICIVLGGKESEDGSEVYAYDTANTLINWACSTYNNHKLFEKGHPLGEVEIKMTALGSKKVAYSTATDCEVYIPNHSNPNVTYKIEYIKDKLTAPVKAGEKIGTARIYCNGELAGECDVVLNEDCEANAVLKIINLLGDYTTSRPFIITLICFVILLPTSLLIYRRKNSHRSSYRKF